MKTSHLAIISAITILTSGFMSPAYSSNHGTVYCPRISKVIEKIEVFPKEGFDVAKCFYPGGFERMLYCVDSTQLDGGWVQTGTHLLCAAPNCDPRSQSFVQLSRLKCDRHSGKVPPPGPEPRPDCPGCRLP